MRKIGWDFIRQWVLFSALFFALTLIVWALFADQSQRNANINLCVRSGYVSSISLADTFYCYRLNGEQRELVSVESLRKEAK